MSKYILTISTVKLEDIEIPSYGIACEENQVITHYISDVSLDREMVEKTIKKFNKHKLSPAQLMDAIEDAIIE